MLMLDLRCVEQAMRSRYSRQLVRETQRVITVETSADHLGRILRACLNAAELTISRHQPTEDAYHQSENHGLGIGAAERPRIEDHSVMLVGMGPHSGKCQSLRQAQVPTGDFCSN